MKNSGTSSTPGIQDWSGIPRNPSGPHSLPRFFSVSSALRPLFRLPLFTLSSLHFLTLLSEEPLLEPQQRDLLLLQHPYHGEQGPQEPGDLFLILLAQGGLLD